MCGKNIISFYILIIVKVNLQVLFIGTYITKLLDIKLKKKKKIYF